MQTSGALCREKAKVRHLFESNPKTLSSSLRTQGPITTGHN
jgi:hypothetical protein